MFNKKVLAMATAALNSAKPHAKKKDIIVDPRGQWEHPGEVTRIPGNDITMQGVPYPVWAVPNVGTPQMMYPEQDYYFPGADHVDEYPQMQTGGSKKYDYKQQNTRYNQVYVPVVEKINDSDLIMNNWEKYPNYNTGWIEYILSGPSKDRNIPYLTPVLKEMQSKLLALPNNEIDKLLKVNWSGAGLPTVLYNRPAGVSLKDMYKYYNHLKYLKDQGYTLQTGGDISTPDLPQAQRGARVTPLYVTDPNDPRIGSYAEAGNQYLYKPVAPKTNPQLEILNLPTKPLSAIQSSLPEPQIIPFVAPENNNIKILEQKDVPRTMRVPVQSTETYYVELYPGGPKVPRQRPVTTYQEVPWTDERAGKVSEYDIKTGTFKKKKGGSTKSSKYSRSLEATNKIFHESHLMKKSKSKKKKIYDPYAKYLQEGGMIDQFHSMPSQRPAFFMGPDGEYVLDPMYEAFSKQKADVAESNRKAQEFNQAYAQSKNYERLLRRQGYTPEEIQKRIGSVMNINDFRYTDTGPSWVGNEDVGKEFISYNVTDPGDWPGFDQIAAHEWGHVGVDTGNMPLKPQEREQFINRIKESEAGVTGNPEDLAHDMEPQENRADLTQLRQQLQETGVFDSRKKKRFTAKDLENYKKMMQSSEKNWNNMWNRMFRLYDDKDIIWFMNNVAQNDIDSQGDDLVKAQVGYAAAPMPRPITDLPEITVKGKKQKSGRIKDSRPEYAKGYYDPYGVPDNTLENIVEIFDPTGMTSWDDVIRAKREFGKDSWQANLERLGAVPLVGKAAKTLKALKYLPMTARQRRSFNTSLNTLRGMGITGKGTDAYQAYDEGLKQKGGFQDDVNKRRRLLTDWTYGKDLGLTQAQNGLIISDPKEYKYRKTAYDDSLALYKGFREYDLDKNKPIEFYDKNDISTLRKMYPGTKLVERKPEPLSPYSYSTITDSGRKTKLKVGKTYSNKELDLERNKTEQYDNRSGYGFTKNKGNLILDYKNRAIRSTTIAPIGMGYGDMRDKDNWNAGLVTIYKKPVQPVMFKEEPSIPVLKTLPLKTLDINLGTQEIIPQTWEYKMDSNPGIVLPESREEWKTLPGTGTKYRVQRPVDPRFSRKYNLRTGSYQEGGSQDNYATKDLQEVKVTAPPPQWIQDQRKFGKDKVSWWEAPFNWKKWGLNDYSDYSSFNSAFRNARESGEKEFVYKGERYNTELIDPKESDIYWKSKEFVKNYYKDQPVTEDRLRALAPYYSNYKHGTNWLAYYDKVKDTPEYNDWTNPRQKQMFDSLDMLDIKMDDPEFLKYAKNNAYNAQIKDLFTPSYFSITDFKPSDMRADGYWDPKKNKTFMLTQADPGKLQTTYVHELSHKADDYFDVLNKVPKIDIKAFNEFNKSLSYDKGFDQAHFDYVSDPSEIEARKLSTLFYLSEKGRPYKSGKITMRELDKLYNEAYADKLPYDIDQLLMLYGNQREDLLKYLNSDYNYNNKPKKKYGGLTRAQEGIEYNIGDEVDEATMLKLKKLGYKFE